MPALSIAGGSGPTGGLHALTEIHSEGLITSETSSRRPIGRLAEKAPAVEDGSMTVLPDGRMRVVFNLRKGVTWHDGTPFTARDLVFSYMIGGPEGIPTGLNAAVQYMSSVEAPDDQTFVVYYRSPYFQGGILGPYIFWPVPRHLLGDAYERYTVSKDPDDVLHSPYWTSGYVHLGPFRLIGFDPGSELTFQAYDGYFLGRPRIGTIRVRIFGDTNTLYSSLLAEAVDMVPELVLRGDLGVQLKTQWEPSGHGTVHLKQTSLRNLQPQWRPSIQMEPAVYDVRVRTALAHALDREALSDAVNAGTPQFGAWSILDPDDPWYEAARDGLRIFPYSPDRAKAVLREAGWAPGPDGELRHASDGRPFRTAIWGFIGVENELAAYASFWRSIGLQVEEYTATAAQTRDNRARAQFPGWDITAGPVTGYLEDSAGTPENNFTGNRSGYDDPRAQQLVRTLKSSISLAPQIEATKRLNDFFVAELPSLPLFFIANFLVVRKGVNAWTDMAGSGGGNLAQYAYGGYSRNAYLWDAE